MTGPTKLFKFPRTHPYQGAVDEWYCKRWKLLDAGIKFGWRPIKLYTLDGDEIKNVLGIQVTFNTDADYTLFLLKFGDTFASDKLVPYAHWDD